MPVLSSEPAMADANIEKPSKRVYVKTFGCQMNVYDSGKMRALLAQDGFAPTADMSEADLVIVIGTSLLSDEINLVSAVMETEPGFDIDTRGSAFFRSSQGAHIIMRWGYGQDYVNEIRIVGETGVIEAFPAFSKPDNIAMTLRIRRQQSVTNIPVPDVNQYAAMLASFAVAIRDRDSRAASRKSALRYQSLLDAVRSHVYQHHDAL